MKLIPYGKNEGRGTKENLTLQYIMITKHRNIYVNVAGMTSVCLGERYHGDCMT
jgi:hypothetical protein